MLFQRNLPKFASAERQFSGILMKPGMKRFFKALSSPSVGRRGVLMLAIAVSPFALSGTGSAHADPLAVVAGQSLDVRADHLDVDIAKGTAVLQGNVRTVLGVEGLLRAPAPVGADRRLFSHAIALVVVSSARRSV